MIQTNARLNSKATAEMSLLVFPKKLKQLTTNSAFSPFHQEVSTLLGKQRPELEVCNKIQGQKKYSFGVKPKLVLHQAHFFPEPVLHLKTLMPIFLKFFPTAETQQFIFRQ